MDAKAEEMDEPNPLESEHLQQLEDQPIGQFVQCQKAIPSYHLLGPRCSNIKGDLDLVPIHDLF